MLDKVNLSCYQELTDVIQQHLVLGKQGLVLDQNDYATLKSKFERLNNEAGSESWDLIWSAVETYLTHSVKTAHPQYFNQLWAGQSHPALIGGIIELLANTSMYTFEVAPMATVVETELTSVIAQDFGLDGWESQVTTGGSNSNFIAVLLALQSVFPGFKERGLPSDSHPRIYVSQESHYSFDKAVMMAGLGLNSLVKIPVNSQGAMCIDSLKKIIQTDIELGYQPCLIAGTAGTTVRGAFDPFESIAKIAKNKQCWFHIDGAWGGAIHYASQSEQWLSGSSQADSFSWDAHKMLGLPLMCSMIFVKEPGRLKRSFQLGDTSYIFHDTEESHDLGPSSLQCGRRVDALKLWFEYLFYGVEGFRQRIDHFLELSAWAEKRVQKEPLLQLQSERWINNICFRSSPTGLSKTQDLNRFNATLRERVTSSGNTLVNQAYIENDLTIRLIIANKDTCAADITRFFDLWISETMKLEKEWAL